MKAILFSIGSGKRTLLISMTLVIFRYLSFYWKRFQIKTQVGTHPQIHMRGLPQKLNRLQSRRQKDLQIRDQFCKNITSLGKSLNPTRFLKNKNKN